MESYVVGFDGAADGFRDADAALLESIGAIEKYYFVGFRATKIYATLEGLATLRANSRVTWIDSSDAMGSTHIVPGSEQTSWAYNVHHFDSAYAVFMDGQAAVRVAVIGDGVECDLTDITCATGATVTTGDPNEDGGSEHETEIASIIAAAVGNGAGIKGGAPTVSLHSVRATTYVDGRLTFYCSDMAEAIEVAVDPDGLIDADVVNLSYYDRMDIGCAATDSSLWYASSVNALVVVLTGNTGVNNVMWPADHSLTVAVGYVTQNPLKRYSSSNWGDEVDITAGGVWVKALDADGDVVSVLGGSFAVPYVVAAFALLIDQKLNDEGCNPRILEMKAALFDNAQEPDDPWVESWYGSGVLDVWAALGSDWMTVPCLE
ncbi:MAG TPA: S8 family serine peptidase [Gemmatimonadales bacterium]